MLELDLAIGLQEKFRLWDIVGGDLLAPFAREDEI